ncbi:MAG: prenyltransferase [Streptosporangiaceae bacterium]
MRQPDRLAGPGPAPGGSLEPPRGWSPGLRPRALIPEVAGVCTGAQILATGKSIAAAQQADGAIGWPDGHVDAWNHTECAMALSVCGLRGPARRAYEWLRASQRPDGSWPRSTAGGAATDPAAESNHAAYPAAGIWHELLVTGDVAFAEQMWPVAKAGIEFALGLQAARGEIIWRRFADGAPDSYALLTASASIYQSLRCAIALADSLGRAQPDWELAAGQLAHVVACHPEAFADKSRYSMDWYYPVLAGPVRGAAAAVRLTAGWDRFVVPGLGARCVSDEPWVTGAETCELAMALDAVGDQARALELFAQIQHLRAADGAYWTGWQYVNQAHFPADQSSWTAAAVILAADALSGATGGSGLFRDIAAGPAVLAAGDAAGCGCDEPPRSADAVGYPFQHP